MDDKTKRKTTYIVLQQLLMNFGTDTTSICNSTLVCEHPFFQNTLPYLVLMMMVVESAV